MHALTVNAPDTETFHMACSLRDLYLSGRILNAYEMITLTREMIQLVAKKDCHVAKVIQQVQVYQMELDKAGILEKEVMKKSPGIRWILKQLLCGCVLLPIVLPGLVLNFPFYLFGKFLISFI